jgi:hypothetical protein
MTNLLSYNWFWLLLFGSVGLAALLLLLLIVYHLARIAKAIERLVSKLSEIGDILCKRISYRNL